MHDKQEIDHVTHMGEPMKPKHYAKDAQRHMGTLEDNVMPVMPLTIGAVKAEDDESHDEHHTHRELTPG